MTDYCFECLHFRLLDAATKRCEPCGDQWGREYRPRQEGAA